MSHQVPQVFVRVSSQISMVQYSGDNKLACEITASCKLNLFVWHLFLLYPDDFILKTDWNNHSRISFGYVSYGPMFDKVSTCGVQLYNKMWCESKQCAENKWRPWLFLAIYIGVPIVSTDEHWYRPYGSYGHLLTTDRTLRCDTKRKNKEKIFKRNSSM